MLGELMKGIVNANLGFAPQDNGEMLIISVPPLTEERRRDLVKRAKAEAENAKVSLRSHRKDALDMVFDGANSNIELARNFLVGVSEINQLQHFNLAACKAAMTGTGSASTVRVRWHRLWVKWVEEVIDVSIEHPGNHRVANLILQR